MKRSPSGPNRGARPGSRPTPSRTSGARPERRGRPAGDRREPPSERGAKRGPGRPPERFTPSDRDARPGNRRPGRPGGAGGPKPAERRSPATRDPRARRNGPTKSPRQRREAAAQRPPAPRRSGPPAGRPRPSAPRSVAAADPRRVTGAAGTPVLPEGPSPDRLRALFARSGLRLSPLQVQQFWAFHQLLRLRNDELDLTRLYSFDTIVLKHYVDCALVATLVDLPSPLLDLGSGAGFPGIPLKIVRPDVHVILGEARAKRVEFLNEAIRELGLTDVEVVAHRVSARFEYPVRGVITRAVETIPATLARVAPWMEPGCRVLFMKGPGTDDELATAKREWSSAFRVVRDVPYTIPETPHARRLVVLERLQTTVEDHVDWNLDSEPDSDAWDSDDVVVVSESGTRRALPAESARAARAPRAPAGREPRERAAKSTARAPEPQERAARSAAPAREPRVRAPKPSTPAPAPAPASAPAPLAPPPAVPYDGGGREHREILSATNDTYKLLRSVLESRGIR